MSRPARSFTALARRHLLALLGSENGDEPGAGLLYDKSRFDMRGGAEEMSAEEVIETVTDCVADESGDGQQCGEES